MGRCRSFVAPFLGGGGAWTSRGEIVFSRAPVSPIFRVSATGGEPVQITNLDSSRQEVTHAWPQFLPDERHFLYLAASASPQNSGSSWGLWMRIAASQKPVRLVTTVVPAIYAPAAGGGSGWLLFARDRILTYQRMDPAAGR